MRMELFVLIINLQQENQKHFSKSLLWNKIETKTVNWKHSNLVQ